MFVVKDFDKGRIEFVGAAKTGYYTLAEAA